MQQSRPDCPDCGNPLSAPFSNCSCGWRSRNAVMASKTKQAHGCEWDDHGFPCNYVGHMSPGTTGDGPWYCRNHFADLMGWTRYEVAENLAIPKRRARVVIEGEAAT